MPMHRAKNVDKISVRSGDVCTVHSVRHQNQSAVAIDTRLTVAFAHDTVESRDRARPTAAPALARQTVRGISAKLNVAFY